MRKFISNKSLLGVLFTFLLVSNQLFAVSADDILGDWTTQEGDSKVTIYKCNDKYCGKITWLKDPNYKAGDPEEGKPVHDRENPDPALKSRPIIGMNLLTGFKFDDDEWNDGKIYDPKSGKTYSCKMTLENPKKLKVRGFIGFALAGRTVFWTR